MSMHAASAPGMPPGVPGCLPCCVTHPVCRSLYCCVAQVPHYGCCPNPVLELRTRLTLSDDCCALLYKLWVRASCWEVLRTRAPAALLCAQRPGDVCVLNCCCGCVQACQPCEAGVGEVGGHHVAGRMSGACALFWRCLSVSMHHHQIIGAPLDCVDSPSHIGSCCCREGWYLCVWGAQVWRPCCLGTARSPLLSVPDACVECCPTRERCHRLSVCQRGCLVQHGVVADVGRRPPRLCQAPPRGAPVCPIQAREMLARRVCHLAHAACAP